MSLFKRILLWLFVTAIVLLAVAVGGMRLLVSNIDLFKSEIEFVLEREIHKGIVFSRVSGTMNRFNPVLRIDNVSINLPDRSQPLFVDRLEVEFDFWRSLREKTPVVFEISGQLEKLEVTRDLVGQWWLNEYRIDSDDEQVDLPGFSKVISLLPRYLNLKLRRLIVYHEARQTRHQLSGVEARIIHRDGRFLTQVRTDLPDEFGHSLEVRSVTEGVSSRIYLDAADVRLIPIASLFGVDTLGLRQGVLKGKLWLSLMRYRITDLQGDMVLNQGVVQVAENKRELAIDYHARFNATRSADRWRVSSMIDSLSVNGAAVPEFNAEIGLPASDDDDRVAVALNQLPVASLPVVAGQWLPDTLDQQIAQGKLKGLLRDLLVEINLDQAETLRLGARVIGLNNQTIGLVPGIDKVSVDLVVGRNKLSAVLAGKDVTLDFGEQFRGPLQAEMLSMKLVMNRLPSGNLLLKSDRIELVNKDVNAIGRLRLETDGDQAPFMYLRAAFKDAVAASTSKYIPVQLMPRPAIEWLDRGIVEGFVPEGELQYHGRLRDIRELAREQAVEFFVDFHVERGNIFFADDWLHARDGYGKVLFHNVGVDFDISSGSYERIDGARARGRIADFDNASLELTISIDASTADAIRVWTGTPIGRRFAGVLNRIQDPGGTVGAEIDIVLPLGEKVFYRKVAVDVDFKDAAGRIPEWGLDLSQVSGKLAVTDDTLSAKNIDARFFGDPVHIDIDSRNSAINTSVQVRGNMASANLIRQLPAYLVEPVSGDSDWLLNLNIAGDAVPEGRPFLHVKASSSLRDTRIDAPQPFHKSAEEEVRLSADVYFNDSEIRFASFYGDFVRGRGSLLKQGEGYRLEALDIAFNAGFKSDQKKGINLYGQIDEVSVDDWIEFLRRTGESDSSRMNEVVLGIDHGTAFRRDFDSAVVEMTRKGRRLVGQLDASTIKGNFDIPLKPTKQDPMRFDLDYLLIARVDGDFDSSALRPSELSAIQLNSRLLGYNEMNFNDFEISAFSRKETLEVEAFKLRRDAVELSGDARWKYIAKEDRHASSLTLRVAGPQLGKALSGLGFGESMSGGNIEADGEFRWPAPLMAFELDNVSGNAKMKITDGVMNNVEPGSGRFVGLLSLAALPRRLVLDFSDVVVEGMEFDEIEGNYRFGDGVLHTENTIMDGPAARIKISGKTGIINRDYDQVMRIAPKIGDTLPLIGALSAGTTVGWGLLILQQLFDTVIDDAVEVEYRVTGSWDDPKIELIKAVDENQNDLPKIDK